MSVFAVFEQSGRDTVPVSIETEVDNLVVQPSLQEWGHRKPWRKYFVQPGEKLLLNESDHWVGIDWDAERVPMEAIVKHLYHQMEDMLIGFCFRKVHEFRMFVPLEPH